MNKWILYFALVPYTNLAFFSVLLGLGCVPEDDFTLFVRDLNTISFFTSQIAFVLLAIYYYNNFIGEYLCFIYVIHILQFLLIQNSVIYQNIDFVWASFLTNIFLCTLGYIGLLAEDEIKKQNHLTS